MKEGATSQRVGPPNAPPMKDGINSNGSGLLREGEELYRALVDNATIGILVRTGDRIVFANPAAAQLLGAADPRELIGRDVLDFFGSEFHEHIKSRRHETETERKPVREEERRLLRIDGTEVHAAVSAAPIDFRGQRSVQLVLRDVTAEHAARVALQASEEQFRRVIDGMNEGLLLLDPTGRITFANERLAQILGSPTEELMGRDSIDVLGLPESNALLDEHRVSRRRGVSDEYDVMLRRKSGEAFFGHISGAPLMIGGRFTGSVALVSDISERKRAEIALRENEEKFHRLLDSMPTYVFSLDAAGRMTAVNEAFCRGLGLDAGDIIGRTGGELGMPPEVVQEWRAAATIVLTTGQTRMLDVLVPIAGRMRTVRVTLNPVRDSDGRIVGVSGVGLDVTEQKDAEITVQRLMRAVEQMDEVMFTTDRAGVITYVNPAFERIYGYSREEAVGQTPRLLKSGEMYSEQYRQMWGEILAGRSTRMEYINRTATGSRVRVISSISPLFAEDGQVSGFVCIQEDVTLRRAAEDEQHLLEERMDHLTRIEALGTLAGGIAHDFNNILSIILSHTTVIERSRGDQQRIEKAIRTVKQAVERGSALSKQVLTFARRTDRQVQSLDIATVLREIHMMIAETLPRSIHIAVEIDPDLPRILGDSGQIHQALLNLCVNARDAMPAGGNLTIRARLTTHQEATEPTAASRQFLCVSVADTGVGIPADAQEHLFEPFFTTKEKGKGTGLGLSVVFGVVRAHGGFIEVESVPGQGTEFRIYLPPSS